MSELIDPIVRAMQIELVDVELKRGPSRSILRLTIDRESGVDVDTCARVSREVEAFLDVEDIVPGSYTLEVSSPGLDRPLRSLGDFRRFAGSLVRVTVRETDGPGGVFVGRITEIDGDRIRLDVDGDEVWVEYGQVKKARLEVEF